MPAMARSKISKMSAMVTRSTQCAHTLAEAPSRYKLPCLSLSVFDALSVGHHQKGVFCGRNVTGVEHIKATTTFL
jgi:hypothetical protein